MAGAVVRRHSQKSTRTLTTMASVEETFAPALKEIARRSTALDNGGGDGRYFEREEGVGDMPFVLPGQDYALVTFATTVMPPRAVDVTSPALRVYGTFASRAEAAEHASVVQTVDSACCLLVVRTREWVLMPQTEACRDDADVNRAHVAQRLAAYASVHRDGSETFDHRVEQKGGGSASCAPPLEEEEDTEVYRPPTRMRSGSEVRGQSVATLSFVEDAVAGEVLVKVLGCFENSASAERWVRNTASRQITDFDIVVASTCEWLFPNQRAVAKTTTTHYRHPELQRIMDNAALNPKMVQDYKTWKAQQEEDQA